MSFVLLVLIMLKRNINIRLTKFVTTNNNVVIEILSNDKFVCD